MNCSKCGEPLKLSERIICTDCREEEAAVDAKAEEMARRGA
ncbi:MAG: hypothetical protein M0021_09640 [Clostridia bacterium]|nr:hypothetical protein [Clostridia bacterium]